MVLFTIQIVVRHFNLQTFDVRKNQHLQKVVLHYHNNHLRKFHAIIYLSTIYKIERTIFAKQLHYVSLQHL